MSTYLNEGMKKEDFTLNGVKASNIEFSEYQSFIYLTFDNQNVFKGTLKYAISTDSLTSATEHNMTEFLEESEEQKALIDRINSICSKQNRTLINSARFNMLV